MRQTHGKRQKAYKRRLMKEMKWERKKWKTNVSSPRRPSVRSLRARGGSSVQNAIDDTAHADLDENGFLSLAPFSSLASLNNSHYDPGDCGEAEEFHSVDETLQPDRGLSVDYEARGITREPLFQIDTGSRGSIMGQELDGETVHLADAEISPSAQVIITDSGVGTSAMTVENVEDSLHVEVVQHSRGEVLDASQPALSRENLAEVNHEIQAPLSHGAQAPLSHGAQAPLSHAAQAVPNQGHIFIQQEINSRSIMGQELDGQTVHLADTARSPSAPVLITDSGVETSLMAVENSLDVEVVQHSIGEVLDASRPALSRENLADVNREIQAPLSHGAQAPLGHAAQASLSHAAQAVPNQGQIFMQEEVAEVDDISIGNPPRTDDVDIHNVGINLRYQYRPSTWDVDLRAERHYNWLLRLSYRSLHKCATCFQRPRQTLNLPCRCLCNCLDCDLVMSKCSMCQRPIRASVICGLRG